MDHTGDTFDLATLLERLQLSHDPNGPIAVAERIAAGLACRDLSEITERELPNDLVSSLVEQFEQAYADLRARAELVELAFERLRDWASKSVH